MLDADLVVLGTGAMPDVMLARSSGPRAGGDRRRALLADARDLGRGHLGAGDPCEYDSVVHGRRLRVEHFEVAAAQGRYAAAAMLGETAPYDEIPYFWSDLADWCTLEYVGPAERWDREVVRGSLDDGEFTIFYLDARPARRRAHRRPLRRPRARQAADRRRGEQLGDRARTRSPTRSTDLADPRGRTLGDPSTR